MKIDTKVTLKNAQQCDMIKNGIRKMKYLRHIIKKVEDMIKNTLQAIGKVRDIMKQLQRIVAYDNFPVLKGTYV